MNKQSYVIAAFVENKSGVLMRVTSMFNRRGFNIDTLTVGETGTGNAIIQVDESGANCIILYGGANQTMDIDFIRSVISGFGAGDMIVLQNEINCMDEILKEAHDAGLTIALNPAPMNDRISRDAMALADWLILNETEAGDLTGKEDWEEQLAALGALFPKTSFLLTLGTRGSICRQSDARGIPGMCIQIRSTAKARSPGYRLSGQACRMTRACPLR